MKLGIGRGSVLKNQNTNLKGDGEARQTQRFDNRKDDEDQLPCFTDAPADTRDGGFSPTK